ncbi:peptidase family M13, partial [Ancylostoma duodenale]
LKPTHVAGNELNIESPKPIDPGNDKYSGYRTASALFKASLNTTVDPCNDFYKYTCGNFAGDMSFDVSDTNNAVAMANQMGNTTYVDASPDPVKQVAWYYQKCSTARMNWNSVNSNGKFVMDAINRIAAGDPDFLNRTQFPFYMFYQDQKPGSFPDRVGMGYLLGYPAGFEGVPSLVTPFVDTNWKDPHGPDGYAYYIDQPTTLLPYTYHVKAWGIYEQALTNSVVATMNLLAKTQNKTLDQKTLLQDAKDIVAFDHLLALTYSTDDTTRRQSERSYNPMTMGQLSQMYPKISWHTFVPEACAFFPSFLDIRTNLAMFQATGTAQDVLKKILNDPTYKYIVMEPIKLQMLNNMLGNTSIVSTRTLVNYIYYTVVGANSDFLPWPKALNVKFNKDDYFTMVRNVQLFNAYKSWDALIAGPTNRIDFNGPPGTTNAWYQPELNSITFPAAILHKPFYDATWPTAVNFGAMGVIAGKPWNNIIMVFLPLEQVTSGHELTHGFDDQGVQWDGTGVLSGWMDNSSAAGFNKMANCVVKEYNNFCPLDKSQYGSASCIDGAQTQGENIADNGGIHAAYRAYRNFINLYGPDPQLPDDLLQEFTADQLFFLSFAQVWCQLPYDDGTEMRQLLVDPHSPSQYRVWGTIQNFAAFKDAFHCPSSAYAPDKHCDVWVSDIDSSYGQPVVKSELNIETNKQITTGDMDKYNAYKMAVNYYQQSVNTTVDPCTDFFQYACGKYDKLVSFHYADANNYVIMAYQLNSPDYQATIQSSEALKKEKSFSDACIAATLNSSTSQGILVSKDYLLPRVNTLAKYLGSNFTYSFGGDVAALPDATQLANALAYLSFTQGLAVDPNLRDKVKGLVEFEQMIANTYSTDDGTRRSYERSWNLMTIATLQQNYGFIDWATYMRQLDQYKKMNQDYAKFDKTLLVNYLFMRLLLQNAQYLPTYASSFEGMPEESFALGRKRRNFRFSASATLADTQASCARMANDLMQFANGRVFIDYLYPDDDSKKNIRDTAGGLIANVIHSFQGMVDQLDWMQVDTKRKAYDKTAGIIQNIAFPDWIMNNTQLDAYYKDLIFDANSNYYDMWTKLTTFNIMLQYQQLTFDKTDRKDFLGQPGTVNAWYQPELNSITFPAGILQPPYFHPQWPASINYGGMGVVAGHELTHGFDDEGVQWGPDGALTKPACDNCTGWMDDSSSAKFKSMAQCVIEVIQEKTRVKSAWLFSKLAFLAQILSKGILKHSRNLIHVV